VLDAKHRVADHRTTYAASDTEIASSHSRAVRAVGEHELSLRLNRQRERAAACQQRADAHEARRTAAGRFLDRVKLVRPDESSDVADRIDQGDPGGRAD